MKNAKIGRQEKRGPRAASQESDGRKKTHVCHRASEVSPRMSKAF